MSLLTLGQSAADQLSLPRPTVVVNTNDPQVRLLLRLANEEGRSLARRHAWQAIVTEHSFTTVATAVQTSSIPTDFGRLIPETIFNRTTKRRVNGPIGPDEWQEVQASSVTRVNPSFRIRGNSILITPTPSAGQSVYYEYVSKNWCQSSGAVGQVAWAADTDTGKLDEFIMTLGVVWRFRADKGLDFAADQADYERFVADAIIADGSRPRINIGSVSGDRVPRAPQMPETITF